MDNRHEIRAIKNRARELNKERSQANSKKQLMSNIKTKFKTTMIGALDAFEKGFGHLWGHGLRASELTEAELEFRENWEEARRDVLDKGNLQSRAAMDEIAQHTLDWNRHQLELVVKNSEPTNE